MKIESHDTNIEQLLTANFFVIPQFQRPYSWDDENLEDFWQDVTQSDQEDYFIGSMVVFKNGRQQFGVVDGQQRLTTITILLCVIRDYFKTIENEALALGLHQLVERTNRDNEGTFVLKTESSFPYFQDKIQNFSDGDLSITPRAEEGRIQSAYELFTRKISKVLLAIDQDTTIADDQKNSEKTERLKSIRDAVLFLKIILVELDDEEDAYLIFETLNTRGKDLALSDLLKNHFSKLIKKTGDVDLVKELWTQLLSELFNSSRDLDPDTFIVHSWSSRFEATTQQKAFKRIKGSIKERDAKQHLKDFASDSRLYRSIFEPSYGWNKSERSIAQSLRALQLFKVSQQTPAVLSLVRAYRSGLIKNRKLRDALQAIENFHFLFTAVTSSRSSGGISAMYSSFGRKLFESETSSEASNQISSLIEKLRDRKPSPSEFSASMHEINYTQSNSKQVQLVRYILKRYSQHLELAFTEDFDDLTIEHIHPQSKSGKKWTEYHIGQIGNLILLSADQNGALEADTFSKKKPHFQKWKSTIPEFVREATDWTPEKVEERTKFIAYIAYEEIWKV